MNIVQRIPRTLRTKVGNQSAIDLLVQDDDGETFWLRLAGNATDEDIYAEIETHTANKMAQATSQTLEDTIIPKRYERWQMWKNTKEEAVARALPAGAITAITKREDAAWNRYLDALNKWRQS